MSIQPSGYQVYQQNAVQTAPPEKLVLMLYDGCLRFLQGARKALEEKEIQNVNNNLVKAQAIINELMANVDKGVGEIGENLVLLYDYMYRKLVEANVKKDAEAIAEVEILVRELRETWHQAITKKFRYNQK